MKIGIIGFGYVGSAVASSYPTADVLINDPKLGTMSTDIAQLRRDCTAIFVCVPTPQDTDGNCDTSTLAEVLESLIGYMGLVICKSTAPPDFYRTWETLEDLKLVHVPEFLTQNRAQYDYVNPHKIVVGCKEELQQEVANVLMTSMINFDRVKIEYCTIAEASFFKYMANNMLAIKVIVNNQFQELAHTLDLNWDRLTGIAKTDSRLGNTHWQVPGPDGQKGFGGACFPKDTKAMLALGENKGVQLSVLKAVVDANSKYRH